MAATDKIIAEAMERFWSARGGTEAGVRAAIEYALSAGASPAQSATGLSEPFEFHIDNCEFETPDGMILGGPWTTVDLSSDGASFSVEAVRFTGTHKAVPVDCHDFIKRWLPFDLSKGPGSLVRQAYLAALIERDESRADDRAEWRLQFLPAAE